MRLAAALLLLAAQDPAAEELHVVKKGNLVPVLELEGNFESVESAEFRIRLEAYAGDLAIQSVAAQGSALKKGEPVAVVDPAPLERQIAAAESDLRLSRATLEKAQAEMDLGAKADALALAQAEGGLKNAETELDVFKRVDGPQMVRQADLTVEYGEDGVKDQQEELDQLKKMYKSEELTNATSEIVIRRAERALKRSRTHLEMTREDAGVVKSVKHPHELQTRVHAVEGAKSALASLKAAQALSRVQRETELVRAKAAAAEHEEKLAKLRRDLDAFTFRAPADGRVFHGEFQHGQWATADQVARMLAPGEKIQAGQVLLTWCGTRVRVRADLPEASYFDVAPGQAATVKPVALPDASLEGATAARSPISAARSAGPAFDLRVDLKGAPPTLLAGMKAKVTIPGAELKDVVLVPAAAVTTQGAKSTVNVSKDGKAAPREVTVGKTDGKSVQVKSGLEAGEKIVLPK